VVTETNEKNETRNGIGRTERRRKMAVSHARQPGKVSKRKGNGKTKSCEKHLGQKGYEKKSQRWGIIKSVLQLCQAKLIRASRGTLIAGDVRVAETNRGVPPSKPKGNYMRHAGGE